MVLLTDHRKLKASYRVCPITERKLFKQSSCLIPISMDQKIHEGEKLEATLDLVNRTFKSCTILVDDTLQRHNLKILFKNISDAELHFMAYAKGDLWIENNKNIYEQLTIPYCIVRWDRWLLHKKFGNRLQQINDMYDTNLGYKNALDANVVEYLERNIKNGVVFANNAASSHCLQYLKEECTVMTLWIEGKYDFILHSTDISEAMVATYEYIIKPQFTNLLRPVALRFKKYGAINHSS